MTLQQTMAEQATGIREHPAGPGPIYDLQGNVITPEQAVDLLEADQSIALPNAGAGSYGNVLELLGYTGEVRSIDTTSSSGEWSFAVNDDGVWIAFIQHNRFPHYGFTYSRAAPFVALATFEELCNFYMA